MPARRGAPAARLAANGEATDTGRIAGIAVRRDADAGTILVPDSRRYLGDSAVLETRLRTPSGNLTVTDWMIAGHGTPRGVLCRRFSVAPDNVRMVL